MVGGGPPRPEENARNIMNFTPSPYAVNLGPQIEVGHPVIFRELEDSNFKRIEAAKAVGLTCGVALPVVAGDVLKAVVVLLCGDGNVGAGALELWHNDPILS